MRRSGQRILRRPLQALFDIATVSGRRIRTTGATLPGGQNQVVAHPGQSLALIAVAWITRPKPIPWVADQRPFPANWVQVNLAAYRPKIAFVFNQLALEPALKQMARTAMASRVSIGIAREQALHATGQVRLWRAEKQVDMVRHEDERKEFPAVPNHGVFQAIEQLLSIHVIPEDRLSRVATRHHVVDCASVLDSQWSGHGGILSPPPTLVNKKQGLTPSTPNSARLSAYHDVGGSQRNYGGEPLKSAISRW